jgi:hypothetical protein
MAGLAAVLAGVWAYRKQRLSERDDARAEADQTRADADQTRADEVQITQRYSTAAEQLGHEKAAVRLAGVFAMARLADDWSKQRQQCIDVLCAYLRMPTDHDGGPGEWEVRATIVRTVAAHLRKDSAISWSKHDFDFTDAALHNAVFDGTTFSGENVSFDKTTFSGEQASFHDATFSARTTSFYGATFSGEQTTFEGATFSGQRTVFNGATFSGEHLNVLKVFTGEDTIVNEAAFSKRCTTFSGATFSGEQTTFEGATFSGKNTSFEGATFPGGMTADEATEMASFFGETVSWGPITPRTLPSPASSSADG